MPSINLLNLDNFSRTLKPVTVTDFFSKSGEFHSEGLFSEAIFGAIGSIERSKVFSYIELNANVIHPTMLKILIRLDRKIEKFLSTEESFALDSENNLIPTEGGVTGIENFINMFPNIKFRGGTEARDSLIALVRKSYFDKLLVVNKLPIIPPDNRPIYQDEDGNWIYDELNNIYLTIMRRASQMKTVSVGSELYDLLNNGLQLAIEQHNKFITSKVEKKRGLIREQLMGKRIDFSGRAVIIPGPTLEADQIGIPFRMAVSIFEPFLIFVLQRSPAIDKAELNKEIEKFTGTEISISAIQKVIKSIKAGDSIPKRLHEIFWNATELAMRGRVVIAKRDPVLHAESLKAFSPVLVDGDVIHLSVHVTGGFNADFDGDQMAIFHPLTNEAQQEAKERMMKAVTKDTSTISYEISKEMCVGVYILTKDKVKNTSPVAVSLNDLETATDPTIPVMFRGKSTTMGKAIVNNCFPPNYPFVDKQLTKGAANGIIKDIVNKFGEEEAKKSISKLSKATFKFATIMAPTMTLDDIEIPAELYKLKEKLKGATTDEAVAILAQMKEILIKSLEGTGLYDLCQSGASKGWDQPMQMLVAKGIIADPQGNILPVISTALSDGLSSKEYFNAARGGRKGIIDRTLNTADTGYTSRKLAYILNSVEANLLLRDCRTTRYLNIGLTKDISKNIIGRMVVRKGNLVEFKESDFNIGEIIQIRSPVYCASTKVCHTCYGNLIKRHRSPYIGIIAAQQIGERGTQLIMRTFHTGGAVTIKQRDILSNMLENDPVSGISKTKLSMYLEQVESQIFCKKKCTITIAMADYMEESNIDIKDKTIWVKSLLSKIEFEDLILELILDYPLTLQVQEMRKIDKDYIELTYNEGSLIFDAPMVAEDLKESVRFLERLLGGKEVYKNTDHLFKKMYNIYGPISPNMDIVHLEVLLSQALRDRANPNMPARLGKKWDPVLMSMKNIVFSSGFIQGVAFEQFGKAVQTGLLEEPPPTQSILERVLTGTLVEQDRRG